MKKLLMVLCATLMTTVLFAAAPVMWDEPVVINGRLSILVDKPAEGAYVVQKQVGDEWVTVGDDGYNVFYFENRILNISGQDLRGESNWRIALEGSDEWTNFTVDARSPIRMTVLSETKSWNNETTAAAAIDGRTDTLYHSANELQFNGATIAYDFGSVKSVSAIVYVPRLDMIGGNGRMRNGVFEIASKSDFSDAVVFHTITPAEADATTEILNRIELYTPAVGRYVRFSVGTDIDWLNIAELEFDGMTAFVADAPEASQGYDVGGLYALWDGFDRTTDYGWKDSAGDHDLVYYSAKLPWRHLSDDPSGIGYKVNMSQVSYLYTQDKDFWTKIGPSWTIQAYVTPNEGWFSPNANSGICGYHSIYSKGLYFGEYVNGKFRFAFNTKGDDVTMIEIPSDAFEPNVPLHLTMTAVPGGFSVYTNGIFVQRLDTEDSVSALDAPGFLVGTAWVPGVNVRQFDGVIHSVRIYSRELSADEIAYTCQLDHRRFDSPVESAWTLAATAEKTEGTVVAELTRNAAWASGRASISCVIGATDAGNDFVAWENVDGAVLYRDIAAFGSGEDTLRVEIPYGGTGIMRFFADGVWSNPINIADIGVIAAPETTPAIGSVQLVSDEPDEVEFVVDVTRLGSGAKSVNLLADVDGETVVLREGIAQTGLTRGVITGLSADTEYTIGLSVENDLGVRSALAAPLKVMVRSRKVTLFDGVYEQLEYIEGTGLQYIDTGVKVTKGLVTTVDIEAPVDRTLLEAKAIFGGGWALNGYFMMFYQGQVRFHSGGLSKDVAAGDDIWLPGERITLTARHDSFAVNGNETALGSPGDNSNYNVWLYWTNDQSQEGVDPRGIFKLYSCEMKEGDNVVRSFTPVRRVADGAVGLYDSAKGGFYACGWFSEGVNFKAGPVVRRHVDKAPDLQIVSFVKNDLLSAEFSVGLGPLGQGATQCDIYAVLSHEGRTVTNKAVSATKPGTYPVAFDGLCPSMNYQIWFYAENDSFDGRIRYPEKGTMSFSTDQESISFGGYSLLTSIESLPGVGQYIDTGVKPSDSLVTEVTIKPNPQHTGENAILGASWSGSGYFMMFFNSCIRYHTGNDYTGVAGKPDIAQKMEDVDIWSLYGITHLVAEPKGFSVNGYHYDLPNAGANDQFNVCLFATTSGIRGYGIFKLFSCTMTDSTGIIRDFYPVRRMSDGAVGLYDRIKGVFYPNANPDSASDFVAGDIVTDDDRFTMSAAVDEFRGKRLSAMVTRAAASESGEVYAVWGEEYADVFEDSWENKALVGTYNAGETEIAVLANGIQPTAKYLRFYSSDGLWTKTVYLPDLEHKTSGLVIIFR